MATLLPQEILDTMMDYLLEDYDDPASSSSLKAASLVCRSFVVPSQSRLFATIALIPQLDNKEKSERRGPSRAFVSLEPKRGFKTYVEDFSCAIAASPHLLGYVRCLDLHIYPRPAHPAPDYCDWLSSESHHLMTFLPNLAPQLRSFGMYRVDWNALLPEVQEAIKIIFESRLLTNLTLEDIFNFPISILASREQLRHLDLQSERHWADSARTYSGSDHQKLKLISLKLSATESVIDWFSSENCIFDMSHLRHLCIYFGQNLTEIFRLCFNSLEYFEMPGCTLLDWKYFDTFDMSGLTALRKLHFHFFLNSNPPVTSSPQHLTPWFNNLLKRQSQMLALEEIIFDCLIISCTLSFPLDISFLSETDSILARGVNLPALRSVTILVKFVLLGSDLEGYMFKVIEAIKMRMPLLNGMGILRVRRK